MSVVTVCEGYPKRRVRGDEITVDTTTFEADPDLWLFEDGVRIGPQGPETTGGRAFTVVAAGDTVIEAREKAYFGVGALRFRGMHYRRDIGA